MAVTVTMTLRLQTSVCFPVAGSLTFGGRQVDIICLGQLGFYDFSLFEE